MSFDLAFQTVDVFTTTRFKGNPLAIVTIPPSPHPQPSQEQKQAIAREFNLSETVFIHDIPESDKGSNKTRKFDIFLTTREIPFAGHPTIGAAISLLPEGVDTLLAKAGELKIQKSENGGVKVQIPYNLHLHQRRLKDIVERTGSNVSLSADQTVRAAELQAPVFSIVKGMTFLLIELPDLETLAKAEYGIVPAEELADEGWAGGFMAKYYYVKMGSSQDSTEEEGTRQALRTRMLEGSFEDPATGSAASCLCSYLTLAQATQISRNFKFQITQGVEMGKESTIRVEVETEGKKVQSLYLEGTAVGVQHGVFTI